MIVELILILRQHFGKRLILFGIFLGSVLWDYDLASRLQWTVSIAVDLGQLGYVRE